VKPNWFVGLRVPPAAGVAEGVTDLPAGVRRFAAEDLHLTVAFLGSVGEEAARRAWAACGLASSPPIAATLAEVVPMGSPRRFSALAAELAEGHREACDLIDALRAPMLAAAGSRPDTRPPRPHVTVARLRRRASPAERRDALAWAAALSLSGASIELTELALFTWSEDRQRVLFRVVESQRLG